MTSPDSDSWVDSLPTEKGWDGWHADPPSKKAVDRMLEALAHLLL